jgi:hypothetical protein
MEISCVFIGVDSGITVVDPGITGVDALHAGCNAGRSTL